MPIDVGWPGPDGDVDPADVIGTIASGAWAIPGVERANDETSGYGIPFVHPAAKFVWHDSFTGYTRYVVFRAPATLLNPRPSCDEQLAEALAEIERLNAALTQAEQQLAEARTEIQRLSAALAASEQTLAALEASIHDLVAGLQHDFRVVFRNPAFVIPGATPMEQLQALAAALTSVPRGPKLQVYTKLGGKPGK